LFYARDAKNLAVALERATASMPAKRRKAMRSVEGYESLSSEAGRKSLRDFIIYCRAGSFRLH